MAQNTPSPQSAATLNAADAGRGANRMRPRTLGIISAAVAALVLVIAVLVAGGSGPQTVAPGASSTAAATSVAARRSHTAHGRSDVRVAAAYLGISPLQLRGQMRLGHTMAQIAASTPGKSVAGLIAALTSSRAAAISAAQADGKLTSAQAQVRLTALHARTSALVSRARPAGSVAGTLPVAAAYLGMTPAELRAAQKQGRSLAQIADSTPAHSAAGLTATIIAADKARIAAEVKSGAMTPAQAHQALILLPHRVALQINAAPSKHA